MNRTVRLCLVRHGETEWNVARRLQGHLDVALNSLGLRQARAAAAWLAAEPDPPVTAIYSSDLARARTTAEWIARRLSLTVRTTAALRERCYGALEGLTMDEVRERHPEVHARLQARDPEFALPGGGESLADLNRRISSALAGIAAAHPGETVVVVSHGGVLDIVNRLVRGIGLDRPRDFVVPNAAMNWILRDEDGWRIESWAEVTHLEAAALDEI